MADVPLYVAIITAGAGIIGAVIPQVTTMMRDVRQAERDRRERSAVAMRDACVDLLRAAGELRTLTENIRSYRGDANGMRTRVEEVRGHAEATRLHAARVSFQSPDRLAEPADQVAAAASALAGEVERNTDLDRGVVVGQADVSALESRIGAFRGAVVEYARG